MPTIKDVAKKAGVALSTASYALNGNKKISETTRQRVLEAAKLLNYKKNGFASDLKKQSTKIIVIILSDFTGPYYSEIIKGVQHTVQQHGYDLIACTTSNSGALDRDSTGIKFLKEMRVDGAIVLSHEIPDDVLLDTAQIGFPIVVLDRELNNENLVNIIVDNRKGGFNATEHLIKLGHRDIAFVGGPKDTLDNTHRFVGYKEALASHNLSFQPKWIFNGLFTRESGYQMTKILLSQQDWPTSIFFGNDEMAIGAIKAFDEKGIRIPDDISIIGFDGIDLTELVKPRLTTINQPKYEIGSLCARFLIHRLNGEDVPNNTKLQTELIMGESTAPPKQKL
ncbi:LacI family DNA-binding transcriptional regulator [Radiobacillus sp. PE A8.2]|uniref:LacI family DNA-binding transcriptional regulator n=1 Tax=Radiobacillus sp. PE A8.2 TaxID=3380349 RepID=UPI0038910C6D